jgi:hypothetical protein
MTLVFCHYINHTLIIVTDSLITGHSAQKPKCASFPAKGVVIAWWGNYDLEPKALRDNPLTCQAGDREYAANNFIGDKLPQTEGVSPSFPDVFLKALNATPHVHNGNTGKAGLLMGVVIRKSIHAFVFEAKGGRGSWGLTDSCGMRDWPQVFGDTDSLNKMLEAQNPKEDLSDLTGSKTYGEFASKASRWIWQTERFQKGNARVPTVGLPAYGLELRIDGTIEGPTPIHDYALCPNHGPQFDRSRQRLAG